jgi:dethiobiotin synthetase
VSDRVLFVTGAGTDVGKTYVSECLLRGLRARGMTPDALKPVMSGFDPNDLASSDAGRLIAALGRDPTTEAIAAVAPFRFAAALPPTIAAARVDRTIYFRDVVAACREAIDRAGDFLLIEGVGGVMSPIAEGVKVIDLIEELEVPALLVGGSHIGAASHALTALAVLDMHNIAVAGVVISESAQAVVSLGDTLSLIVPYAGDHHVMALPRNADRSADLAELALAATAT